MSIWAEVKYALNSSLGTVNFKPINEIIIGSKQIIADEDEINCYIPMVTGSFEGKATTPEPVASFRTRFAGSFYVQVEGNGKQINDSSYTSDKYKPYLYVYVNGVVRYGENEWKLFEKTGANPASNTTFTLPYQNYPNYVLLSDVPANALIEIKYYCGSVHNTNTSYLNLTSLYLKGIIKEMFAEGV